MLYLLIYLLFLSPVNSSRSHWGGEGMGKVYHVVPLFLNFLLIRNTKVYKNAYIFGTTRNRAKVDLEMKSSLNFASGWSNKRVFFEKRLFLFFCHFGVSPPSNPKYAISKMFKKNCVIISIFLNFSLRTLQISAYLFKQI